MSALAPYRVAAGPFAGAFRMDGRDAPDMRKAVKLGDCNCCDYFYPKGGNIIVLVEETHLTETLLRIQDGFNAAPAPVSEASQAEYINNRVMWENRLKVYGGMLVLQRFAAQCDEVAALLRGKKYQFRLVDMGTVERTDKLELNNLRNKLFANFRGIFSREMIASVSAIRLADLGENAKPGFAL